MSEQEFQKLLQQCRTLTNEKRNSEALTVAQKLLQLDAENIAAHKLLALLYGLNNQHGNAHKHYMLLVQFDASYTLEHCLQVARGYTDKGEFKEAGLICMAAFNRIPDKKLVQFAVECFERASDTEWLERANATLKKLA
jgi:tetratricopeptide (TPR) repeat protein